MFALNPRICSASAVPSSKSFVLFNSFLLQEYINIILAIVIIVVILNNNFSFLWYLID